MNVSTPVSGPRKTRNHRIQTQATREVGSFSGYPTRLWDPTDLRKILRGKGTGVSDNDTKRAGRTAYGGNDEQGRCTERTRGYPAGTPS